MNTYLFVWNPEKWPWPDISHDSLLLEKGNKIQEAWNCVSHKKIRIGDRAFVSRVGSDPRGIFASGHIASEPFLAKSRKGKEIHNVMIQFDALLDPSTTSILTLELLRIGPMEKQLWTPQSSGIAIKKELTEELEVLWVDFLREKKADKNKNR